MRAVIQRILEGSVSVDGSIVGSLSTPGLLVYVGVTHTDTSADATWMARKVHTLRLMRDEQSLSETGGGVLAISQFTLYGDARRGRRPTWQAAAPGAASEPLYDEFCSSLAGLGVQVERGVFGADMRVASVNDGPVTLVLESP